MNKTKTIILSGALATSIMLSGCKPYEVPEFVTIEPNQTAFVIPLTGATSDQGKFESEQFLKDAQVATKEIKIEKRWVQKGRLWFSGEWRPEMRVIVVDRYPITREWGGKSSFVGESKDSIKFNQGMSATAQILEEDTATFLYQYAGKTLEEVMDTEIRNYIGSVLLEKYSSMSIDNVRADKTQVINHVRKVVEPYFKERGITLSNIGYIGDLKYLQEDIQKAINKDFIAQQEQKAQETINKTEIEKARAEAEAARTRQASLSAQIEIMRLENEKAWIEKWDGTQPNTLVNGNSDMMINVPSVNTNK